MTAWQLALLLTGALLGGVAFGLAYSALSLWICRRLERRGEYHGR